MSAFTVTSNGMANPSTDNELKAITAAPPPDVRKWAFHPENNLLFSGFDERTSPEAWVSKGHHAIAAALSRS